MTPSVQYRVRSYIKLSNWKDEDSMIQVWCQGMAMSGKIIASSNIFEPSVCHHLHLAGALLTWRSLTFVLLWRTAAGLLKLVLLLIAADPQESEFHGHHNLQKTSKNNIVFRFSGQSHQWSDSCCEARFRRLATRLGAVSDYPCVGKALPTKVNVITTGAIGCCSQSLADSCGAELVWDEQQDWRKTALNENGDQWGPVNFVIKSSLPKGFSALCPWKLSLGIPHILRAPCLEHVAILKELGRLAFGCQQDPWATLQRRKTWVEVDKRRARVPKKAKEQQQVWSHQGRIYHHISGGAICLQLPPNFFGKEAGTLLRAGLVWSLGQQERYTGVLEIPTFQWKIAEKE